MTCLKFTDKKLNFNLFRSKNLCNWFRFDKTHCYFDYLSKGIAYTMLMYNNTI